MPGTDELADRLGALVGGPVDAESAYARLMRRHRLRRLRRAGLGLTAAAAVAVGVLVAVPDERDSKRVDVVDDGGDRDEVPAVAQGERSRTILRFGSQGISITSGDREMSVWPGAVSAAFPDHMGGIVFQEVDAGPIRWLADLSNPSGTSTVAPPGALLHAVIERDGQEEVFFTRRSGEGESSTETLFSYSLLDQTVTEMVDTGGSESGLDAVAAMPDGQLVLSTCHLQCTVWTQEKYQDFATAEPLIPPDWIAGLDIAAETIAYVRYTFTPDSGTTTDPVLVIADLSGETLHEVPLPMTSESGGAMVDLDGDAQRVIVSIPNDGGSGVTSVLVDNVFDVEGRSIETLGEVGAAFGGSIDPFAADCTTPDCPAPTGALGDRELEYAFLRDGATWARTTDGEEVRLTDGTVEASDGFPLVLADGHTIVHSVASFDGVFDRVVATDARDGSSRELPLAGTGLLALSPDTTRIAATRYTDESGATVELVVLDSTTFAEVANVPIGVEDEVGPIQRAAWNGDGASLLVTTRCCYAPEGATQADRLWSVDLPGNSATELQTGSEGTIWIVADRASDENTIPALQLADGSLTWGSLRVAATSVTFDPCCPLPNELDGSMDGYLDLSERADGRWLVSDGRNLFELDTAGTLRRVIEHATNASSRPTR